MFCVCFAVAFAVAFDLLTVFTCLVGLFGLFICCVRFDLIWLL